MVNASGSSRTFLGRTLDYAALVLTEHNALWCKSLLQHRERFTGVGIAAHEDIERGITAFGPCMNADVAFGQYSDAAYAPAGRKGMQVNVQERRSCCFHCINHCLLDPILIVEAFRLPKIDDQVTACKGHPVFTDEVIFAIRIPFGNRNRDGPRRSACLKGSCSIDRRHTESELSHPGTYPSKGVDTKARHCWRANPRRKRRTEEQLPQHAAFAPDKPRQGKYRAVVPQRKKIWTLGEKNFVACSGRLKSERTRFGARWTESPPRSIGAGQASERCEIGKSPIQDVP